jgi:signal transduction histidine kinase
VLLSVRDEGVGIPKDKQRVIFERFGRAHGSKYGGLGLGLTITQGIVEQHGGRIWVESEGVAGKGTTFFVRLPREVAAPHAADGEPGADSPAPPGGPPQAGAAQAAL